MSSTRTSALRDGGEGLPPGRRHRSRADLGTAVLRGPAAARVRLHGVRRRARSRSTRTTCGATSSARSGLGRQSLEHQRLGLLRELGGCAADQCTLLLRLRLHGERRRCACQAAVRSRCRRSWCAISRPRPTSRYSHAALVSSDAHRCGLQSGNADPAGAAMDLVRVDRLPARPDGSARADGTRRQHLCRQPHGRRPSRSTRCPRTTSPISAPGSRRALVRRPVREQRGRQAGAAQQHHAGCRNLPTFNRVAVSQPRTAGIDLNYKFGNVSSPRAVAGDCAASPCASQGPPGVRDRQRHVAEIDVRRG